MIRTYVWKRGKSYCIATQHPTKVQSDTKHWISCDKFSKMSEHTSEAMKGITGFNEAWKMRGGLGELRT